jgi:hypothetical protein
MFMIGSFMEGASKGLTEGYALGRQIKADVIAQRNAAAVRQAELDKASGGLGYPDFKDPEVIDKGPQTGQPGTADVSTGAGNDWYKPGETAPPAPPPGTKVDVSKLPKVPPQAINTAPPPNAATDASAGVKRPPDRGGAADSSAGMVRAVGRAPDPFDPAADASRGMEGGPFLAPGAAAYQGPSPGAAFDASQGALPISPASYQGPSPGAAYDASGSPLFGATAYEGVSPGGAYDASMVGGTLSKPRRQAIQRASRAQAPQSTAGAPGYPGTTPNPMLAQPQGTSTMQPGYAVPGTAVPIDPRTGLPLLPQSQAIGPSALPAYPYDPYATPVR